MPCPTIIPIRHMNPKASSGPFRKDVQTWRRRTLLEAQSPAASGKFGGPVDKDTWSGLNCSADNLHVAGLVYDCKPVAEFLTILQIHQPSKLNFGRALPSA